MSAYEYQQAMAIVLNTVLNEKGWLCRTPLKGFGETHPTDNVFPHFGALLGLQDYFTCYALLQMCAVKLHNSKEALHSTSARY